MKILSPLFFLLTITAPANAQAEFELGGSFWFGSATSADNLGSSAVGLGGWTAIARNSNRAVVRFDYFGIARDCSSCGDGDGLMLFLMIGRQVNPVTPLVITFEAGPGYLDLGRENGFGARIASSVQVRIWHVGVAAEVFAARSLGPERIRPSGLGVGGTLWF